LVFSAECENQNISEPILSDDVMGIDLGVRNLAIAVCGNTKIVIPNINKTKRMKALIKKKKTIQRNICRKYNAHGNYEKTNNIIKLEAKISMIDAKIANIRHNYIHQVTTYLANMFPKKVVMEDLAIKNMMKNRRLSRAIGEQSWYKFIITMKYKCEERGIEFIQVDRFYPSSKTCSICNYKNDDVGHGIEYWTCPNCGSFHNRDINAARNLIKSVG